MTATAAAGGVFLAGVPFALARLVGNPLPAGLPTLERFEWHLTNGQIPDRFWIGALALVIWVAWTQLVAAAVVEGLAAVRGVQAPTLVGFGWAQRLTAPVMARTAMAAAVVSSSPAMTAGAGALAPLELAPAVATNTGPLAALSTNMIAGIEAADAAGSSVAVEAAPEMVSVQHRDSLRSIAADRLGDADRWPELRAANVGRTMTDGTVFAADQTILQAGWVLTLPTTTEAGDGVGEGMMVEVVKDDHFWALAEQALTDAWGRAPSDAELTPYWAEMVEANVDRLAPPEDPNLIYPGQSFVVPDTPPNPDHGPTVSLSASETLEFTITDDTGPTQAPAPVDEPSTEAEVPEPVSPPSSATPVTPAATGGGGDGSPDESGFGLPAATTLATIGVTAFTAGLVLVGLRAWRRRRIARTVTPLDPQVLPEPLARAEDQIRALADDGEAARYTAAFNPWLSHVLEGWPHRLPSIVAIKAGSNGLEVLLQEPAEMPDKFVPISDDGRAWRLTSDVSDRQMEHDAAGAVPMLPMLTAFGDTPSGELLVDVEQLGMVSVSGPNADQYLRSLAVSLLAAPWADQVQIVAIGIPDLYPTPNSRVTVPADPTLWARQTVSQAERGGAGEMSTYELRTKGMLVDTPARIVLVGSGQAAVAQHLAKAAEYANQPFALIAATELTTEYRFVIAGDTGKLEPFGLECDARLVEAYDLTVIDDLTTTALEPDPVDTEPVVVAASNGATGGGLVDVPATPAATTPTVASQDVLDQIAQITEPRGVEVTVLGDKPTVTGAEVTPQQVALTAFLALNPGTSMDQLREEFWGGPDKKQTAWNAISKLRRQLGETPDGDLRLPKTASFTLLDTNTDWARFGRLVDLANTCSDPTDIAAALDAALGLLEGRPAAQATGRMWRWFVDNRLWYETIDTAIVAAAKHRAELGLEAGHLVAARHAIRTAQRAVGTDNETLLAVSLQVTKHLDGDRALDDEMAAAIADANKHDYDLNPRLHHIYETLQAETSPLGLAPGS